MPTPKKIKKVRPDWLPKGYKILTTFRSFGSYFYVIEDKKRFQRYQVRFVKDRHEPVNFLSF